MYSKTIRLLLIALFGLLITGCVNLAEESALSQTQPEAQAGAEAASSTETEEDAPQPVALEPAFGGISFQRPIELGPYPDNRIFIAEQAGQILLIDLGSQEITELLDFSPQVSRDGNEEGLLSVALDPAFDENGYLWTYYSVADGPRRTRLSRFEVADDAVDLAGELVVLELRTVADPSEIE